MKDKKNHSSTESAYIEAELVKGASWYIKFKQTNPNTGELERFRRTFDLNHIKDLKQRERAYRRKIKEINQLLPTGFPFAPQSPKQKYDDLMTHLRQFIRGVKNVEHRNMVGEQIIGEIKKLLPDVYPYAEIEDPKNTPILEALNWVEKEQAKRCNEETMRKKERFLISLRGYLSKNKIENMRIVEFSNLHASETMRYINKTRKINNNTYNKIREDAIIFFNLLEKHKYIHRGENPFKETLKKNAQRKRRRNLTKQEKQIIKEYLIENDYSLYLAAMLQYCCQIRPSALNELKFEAFNF